MADRAKQRATESRRDPGWSLQRRLSVGFALLAVLVAVLATIEALALSSMDTATNTSIARLDPAQVQVQVLINDLTEETTAVRSYLVSGNSGLLFDYNDSPQLINIVASNIRQLIAGYPALRSDLDQVVAANNAWRTNWADPSIGLKNGTVTQTQSLISSLLGNTDESNKIVAQAGSLDSALAEQSDAARATLNSARERLTLISILVLVVLIGAALAIFLGLRRWVARPTEALDVAVRAVAEGDLYRDLDGGGPPEIAGLAESVGIMRDRIVKQLEDVRAAHDEIAEQAEALRMANADLERFADVASHDLQEPLRKVAGFCDLLIERYGDRLDERGLEFVQYAADGSRRMQDLIDDLLSFSRVTKANARFRLVELSEVVAVAERRVSPMLEAAGGRVEVDPLAVVDGDPALLAQLFTNVLDNAIRYRSPRPLIVRIRGERVARPSGDVLSIEIADNGTGIQPEYAERVFRIFQRLRHDDPASTGIGLALCERIAEVHGGRIWADTGRIDGATIHLELPLPTGTTPGSRGDDADVQATGAALSAMLTKSAESTAAGSGAAV